MKTNKLVILTFFVAALAATGCKKDSKGIDPVDTTKTTPPAKAYVITEGFESGSKTAYADATVTLSTGSWDLNDAVIGNLATDVKNGAWAVRLRTGSISMMFDINGLTQISIKHAKYGADAASTWQLMMSDDGGTTYKQVGTDISETSTTFVTDSFKVTTTKKVRFKIQKTGTTRINLDDITFKGTGDSGVTVTDDDGNDGGSTSTPAGARDAVFGADAPPTTGDNSDLLMGNPSNAVAVSANTTNYLIDAHYYTESYNSTKGIPNWVSWHLDATNTTGVTDRLNNFAAFSQLPTGYTVVQSNSYNGSVTGFDRGHNCPSADRTSSANANSATFLMINMIPQAPYFNQHPWADMEGYLRNLAANGNELYIIMGNYGTGGTGSTGSVSNSIATNGVTITVPAHVWKIAVVIPTGNGDLARVDASTKVIAVDMPNINTVGSDWKQYVTTVRSIETATGLNLLSALPQNVQDAIEVKAATGL
ncbi:endonuclease G [Mucilaginibacter yixingensis]|uniref:Endonuclease G n=1 Tax=Mucilaginibacter yixingensis TaxID=1295612 RepID=A0A2T5JE04_9SPHI|nr:DNA/RNA non-specific endonuclease [Mucilaginibacter yixingensis]PTQ99999.1 endonuclease G [Mucilaginibacter yixingensis]